MTKSVQSCRDYIKCICPKCEKEHKLLIFWTGGCIPRKFCEECRKLSERIAIDPWTSSGYMSRKMPADQCDVID